MAGERFGPYLLLRDAAGLRHLARINSVALVSETDEIGDDVCLVVSGRPIRLQDTTLDEVMTWLGVSQ